jgi:uncharacterized protein with von Willebrand factor type A (vWA) domain
VSGPPTLFAGVDRAALAAALGARLRAGGVPATLTGVERFTRALADCPPRDRDRLYWLARTTLVHDRAHLPAFDAVFAAVFDEADVVAHDQVRRSPRPGRDDDRFSAVPGSGRDDAEDGGGLPWATLPAAVELGAGGGTSEDRAIPERLPSDLEARSRIPFEELDPDDLARLGAWLETAFRSWPRRRTRRQVRHPSGTRIDPRQTIARSRRTDWEPIELVRRRRVRRPRRLLVLCDVSQSMQAHASAYLHLMRAAVQATDAEVFAFATSLTRLTPILAHRDVETAIALASDAVGDRFGGTRIATNVRALLASRHGHDTRGAIVVVASDGWDADPAPELAAAMARLRRRAHRVVWLNPRAGVPGYEPLVGAMAAALPYVDDLLPAATLQDLLAAVERIAGPTAA